MDTGTHLHARNGLASISRVLNSPGACTIAYLGGSITWGGNATDIERFSFRARTTKWLRERFPRCTIREINAGLGGTGVDLAAFRLEEDVLQHDPALVVIEFAVNDTGARPDYVVAAMEGIVRRCIRHTPRPELCFVYTLAQCHLDDLAKGALPLSVVCHERVAQHYGYPSVNLALPVATALRDKTLEWSAFCTDTVHPSDHGHELYAKTLVSALETLFATEASPRSDAASTPKLSEQPWETARLIPVTPEMKFSGWAYRALQKKSGWDCFAGLLESNQPGAEATFEFSGTVAGLYFQLGPESGDMIVTIDNFPPKTLRVFDDWSLGGWRPQYRILRDDLTPGAHRIRVKVGSERDARSRGHWTKLANIMCR